MSDQKVTFTVTVHDVDLATWAKVEDVSEADAADEFALIASHHVGDAIREKFDNQGLTIATTREDGSLLYTERPGDFPD
ncbi:hypothetical protein [Mycobacterium sp.]|uniref:hypothetical protein n=1 Tax=Mycobacterium sp. TaxID=1785 RepID=UPI003BAF04A6